MATRFTAASVGNNGTSYNLIIDDASFGGSNTDIEIQGFQLSYDPDEQDDPITSIIASSCNFNIVITDTTRTAINALIDDLVTADEGRFRVKITKSGSIWWLGYILTDQISIEDQDWADSVSLFNIRAVDGISRLKDLDYNDAGTAYSGRVTVKEHLFNILSKIGLSDFYGGTDNFLFTICRWYEDSMGASVTDDPLAKTYIDHSIFIDIDSEGNEEFTKCYDVLKQIAQLFLARFYYSNGVYRYDQISEYRESTVTRHRYYKDGTKNTSTTGEDLGVGENSDNILRLGNVDARKFYFAPARKITLTFNHRNDRNYLAGQTWDADSDPSYSTYLVGRENIRLWIRGKLRHTLDFTPDSDFQDCFAVFKFFVTATVDGTTYYAKRDYSVNNGVVSFDAMSWTTTATDRISIVTENMYLDAVEYQTYVNFETAELPGTGEFAQVAVDVNFHSVWLLDGVTSINPSYTESWEFYDAVLQLNADDPAALTQKSIFQKSNADTPNASLVLGYETKVSDSPSSGTLFVSSNLTIDNAGVEEISNAWAKGTGGGGQKMHYLWLDEALKLRTKSLARYEGQMIGAGYHPHNLVEFIDGSLWVMQRLTYDSKNEIWGGDWFFVGWDDTLTGTTGPVNNVPLGPGEGPPLPPGNGPKFYNPIGDTPGDNDPVAQGRPTGGHVVTTTDGPIAADTPTTSISINPTCDAAGGMVKAGDTINIYDPLTGNSYEFTVTADVAGTDTSISVSSATPDVTLSDNSLVIVDTCSFVSNIRSGVCGNMFNVFRESFTMNGTDTSVTITVNGGTLPDDNTQIDVWYDATPIFETDAWTKSGSDLNFTFTPENGAVIRVKFSITNCDSLTRYEESFTGTSATKTITVNGGALPANTAQIDVWYDATPIFEGDGFNVSGSDIILTFTPEAGATVRVKFWA